MASKKDHHTSPFTPGYGKQPLVFGGHSSELEELTEVFETMDFGENDTVLISGLRGAGKTSMLTVLQDAARRQGWLAISDDASAGLMERIMESSIPTMINQLRPEQRHRLTELGLWRFNMKWEYEQRPREVKPLLRHDLFTLSQTLDQQAGILITIDEVSSGKVRLRELSRVALEISHAITQGAPIMFVLAGVKVDLEELLQQPHMTFLRRSKDLNFQRLTPTETRWVLSETIRIGGRHVQKDALDLLVSLSQGYPYLVQLAGDYAWRNSPQALEITSADAEAALEKAVRAVQRRVISRVYLDLSEKDQEFLQAMAVDDDRSKIADVADRMGVSAQYAQVYKNRLIDSGYVQQDGHGHVKFSLPYLRQYVRSTISETLQEAAADDGWDAYPAPKI